MYNISRKYKQFWFLLIKMTIIFGAGYFIYQRTFYNSELAVETLFIQVKKFLFKSSWIIPTLIGMTLINWLLEILKWKVLVNTIQKISFLEATRQSLSSHTLSLLTPFKLGEYGGKALYFQKDKRNKIWLLNLGGNFMQLVMTLFFGMIGFVYFINTYEVAIHPHKLRTIAYVLAMLLLVLFGGAKVSSKNQKGNYYTRLLAFLRKQSYKNLGVLLLLSFLRYMLFSHQFYFLLLVFGIEIAYTTAMMLIFTMYFLATMLPTINLFDFVIKGSVAMYLFSFLQVDETSVISIATIMWLLNFALPALMGSYFVLVFKTDVGSYINKGEADLKSI